ncbi:hypothetical protein ACFX2F_022975 [Malus domestica]
MAALTRLSKPSFSSDLGDSGFDSGSFGGFGSTRRTVLALKSDPLKPRLDQIWKQADDHRTLALAYASCARKLKLEKSKLVRVFADLSRNYSDLMNKPVASVKKLCMTLIQSPDLPVYAVGDENRLLQTILDIAESSRDWQPPEFYPASTDGYFYLRVQVKDSGCGVLPEDIPHLFTKFSQPRNRSNQINNGAGLGLAICKRFVNTMGGRIWIESEGIDRGSLDGLMSFSQISNLANNEMTDDKYYKMMQLDDTDMPPQKGQDMQNTLGIGGDSIGMSTENPTGGLAVHHQYYPGASHGYLSSHAGLQSLNQSQPFNVGGGHDPALNMSLLQGFNLSAPAWNGQMVQSQPQQQRSERRCATISGSLLFFTTVSSPLLPISSKQQRRRQSLRHQGCTALLLPPPPSLASQLPPTSKTAVKRLAGREALPQTPALRPSSSFPTKSLSQAS